MGYLKKKKLTELNPVKKKHFRKKIFRERKKEPGDRIYIHNIGLIKILIKLRTWGKPAPDTTSVF